MISEGAAVAGGVFGPYRLDGLLGRGGMGEVYRAVDTRKRDRLVALKLLPEHLSTDDDFRARFRREAEVVASLREPHVVPVHDYGEIDGRLYLDMRLVDGVDLATVLRRDGALAPERAVSIVEQVAAALDAAHAMGLVHRDVKPSNILVVPGRPEFVYLVDFGIARDVTATALTAAGATVGTLEYMAPERLLDGTCDHRADIYSLGCVLHEALTGRAPFVATGPAALMYAHVHTPPPRPSEHRHAVPAGLDAVVATAMAKDPRRRHARATELTGAARAALDRATVPPAAPFVPAPTWIQDVRRRPPVEHGPPVVSYPFMAPGRPPTPPPLPPTLRPTPASPPQPRRNRTVLAVGGVVAAVALVLAVSLISFGRGGSEVAPPTPTPTVVVPEVTTTVEVASVADTTWDGSYVDGGTHTITFHADGTTDQTTRTGTYARNGVWDQSGSAISIRFNNGYATWTGRIDGDTMSGTASNITGKRWNWSLRRQ